MPHPRLEDYAIFILSSLRSNGYEAFFVGGCVRDTLLGRIPKDYDVATNASPEGILQLFPGSGIAGAHFGVVLVREGGWQVEVATFRSDGEYSDGRRPDSVRFTGSAEEDAARRDFTINGLFRDPLNGTIVDFVGGKADLEAGIIRAIGDPMLRFEEDHLRLLRAIRFAARFGFVIEERTMRAIHELGALVQVVAVERVRDELNRILLEGGVRYGLELLRDTGMARLLQIPVSNAALERFQRNPQPGGVPVAWAALLLESGDAQAQALLRGLRFSNREVEQTGTVIAHHGRANRPFLDEAERKRFMRLPTHETQMELHRMDGLPDPQLPVYSPEQLFPAPVITGDDLQAFGIAPGPVYAEILRDAETAQLNGELHTREQALAWLAKR